MTKLVSFYRIGTEVKTTHINKIELNITHIELNITHINKIELNITHIELNITHIELNITHIEKGSHKNIHTLTNNLLPLWDSLHMQKEESNFPFIRLCHKL